MSTNRRGEKLELELLPEELYGNFRGSLNSSNRASERPNPALQGSVLAQLYHRNVYHMAALYVLLCWVVVEIAPPLFKELQIPSWFGRVAGIVAVLGFPLIMLFAWSKERTVLGWQPVEKVRVDDSLNAQLRTQLNRAIFLVLVVGVVYLALARFWFPPRANVHETALQTPAAAVAGNTTTRAAPAPAIPIAVLAFTDQDAAKDLGYLANGLAEELLPVLATLPQLVVTGGDSSFRRFKSGGVDVVSTGAALGVRYLVGGSVRRVEDRAQVTVELIDARDGTRSWTETFEGELGNAIRLRDDVAAGLAKALAIPVGADGVHARRVLRSPNAMELYLRGREAFTRGDRPGYEQAADLYMQALDLEPQSATIEAGLAELDLAMVQRGYLTPQIGVERARKAAELAASLDINLAKAHRVLAWIDSRYDGDWHAAARELDLAASAEAHDPKVLADLGYMNLAYGRVDKAAQYLQEALVLDPLDADILLDLALAQSGGGKLAPAEASLRRALQLDPNLKAAHFHLGRILLAGGDQRGALAEVKREPDARHRLAGMAEVLYAMGQKSESDAALAQLKPLASTQWGSGLAGVYASRNEADAAFEWLDRAYVQKDADLQLVRANRSFQSVSSDPRFREWQRRMNLPD